MPTVELPQLYPKQHRAVFDAARYAWIEASTKAGKTFGCIVWLLAQALEAPYKGGAYWWVAPVSTQADMAFDRLRSYLPDDLYTANLSKKYIQLQGAGRIWFKSGDKPDSLYGEDVHAAVIDEASRVKSDSWLAVRSTLTATKGPIRIIGNVQGRHNWFYKGCRKAEQSDGSKHSYHKLTALDAVEAGVFPQEELDDARATLPEYKFRELYLAQPADDGGNPFGLDAIDACTIEEVSEHASICWGWDLARSVDWTVGVGLDREGYVCAFERFQKPWPETEQRIIQVTGRTPALVDSTGPGDSPTEHLQRQSRFFEGFKFTARSKQQLMEGLALAIQAGEVRFPDNEIKSELELFEYEQRRNGVRYSAPSGLHDDCVCALALAVKKHAELTKRRKNTTTTQSLGSFPSKSSGFASGGW
jgi:hypothetical protein